MGRGNTSLVLRCRAGRRLAVLKLTPEGELAAAEGRALRAWESSGRVPLVWGCDEALGALLMEAIPDERPLSESAGDVSLPAVADLIAGLHRSAVAGEGVASLGDRVEFLFRHWIERYGRSAAVTKIVAPARLERGHELARALAAEGREPAVLLHGDLHPGNVLDGGPERGLVVIDPRPCVGEPAFDALDWVFWQADEARWRARSRDLSVMIGVGDERLWSWCAAFAALLAASEAATGPPSGRVEALLRLAP